MKLLESRFLAICCLLVAPVLFAAESAQSLPALQLGPGTGNWFYDTTTETWLTSADSFQLMATANATSSLGGDGQYAWQTSSTPRVAYLVVASMPLTAVGDSFDITVMNDAVTLSLYASGYGIPPLSDPNDIHPHGEYPTYFEIYRFTFDDARVGISDTQPGATGTGMGYTELFDITINSLADSSSLHFDLFTMYRTRGWVYSTAPFSHDAGALPEPRAAVLCSVGSVIAGVALHRRR